MKELIYTVKVESGIGMKASGPLAVAANSYPCKIQFHKEGDSLRFDMKRVLSVASMSVKRGDQLVVTFEGEKEDEAMAAIQRLLEENV